MVVTGEAGVGKSRLTEDFLQWASEQEGSKFGAAVARRGESTHAAQHLCFRSQQMDH